MLKEVEVAAKESTKSKIVDNPVFIEFDKWLTDRIGKDAYHLSISNSNNLVYLQRQLTPYAEKESFFQIRISPDFQNLVATLNALKFKQMEKLVTFLGDKIPFSDTRHEGVRWVTNSDRRQVLDIARSAFTYSRFHRDKEFSHATANRIKVEWVDEYFKGTRDARLAVVEENGKIFGFTLIAKDKGDLVVDLIAVSKDKRGKGLGRSMIHFIRQNYNGAFPIRAGTQEHNEAAMNLYQSLGFRIVREELTFHRHGSKVIYKSDKDRPIMI